MVTVRGGAHRLCAERRHPQARLQPGRTSDPTEPPFEGG